MILRVNYAVLLCIITLMFAHVAEAKGGKHQIYKVSSSQITNHIKTTKGTRRAIVFYAQWCPQCIQKMPELMKLERAKPNSIIAISVDDNFKKFSRYINKFDDVPFKIMLHDGKDRILYQQLKRFGIEPRDGVPDIIFMDENNQTVFQGNYDVEDVEKFLNGEW